MHVVVFSFKTCHFPTFSELGVIIIGKCFIGNQLSSFSKFLMEILRASVLRVFDFEFDILRSLGMIFIKRDLTNSKNENLPILKIVLHKISIVERMTSPPHRPL